MIPGDVMQGLADRLDTITTLRVSAYPPGTIAPPAAIVGYPDEIVFDEGYNHGLASMDIPVWVVIGKPTDRQTRDLLSVYCAGTGASSVKAVLESGTYTAMSLVYVGTATFDTVTIGAIDYVSAKFQVTVKGTG